MADTARLRPIEYIAIGFMADAEAYLVAANQIDLIKGYPAFSPKYFLLCHSIELILKAYILAAGGKEAEPKQLGHNLQKAFARARGLGLSASDTRIQEVIEWLNPFHMDHVFRYRETGYRSLPLASELADVVGVLIQDVAPTVKRKAFALARKPS